MKVNKGSAITVDKRFDTSYLEQGLKKRSLRGGTTTVLSQGCRFLINTLSTVILARLLTPGDFGIIAMVLAITNFAMIFRDLGLSTAVIQKAEITQDQVSVLFWVNAGVGFGVSVLVAALAPVVVWFYKEPKLLYVTMALGTTFIFSGLSVQHQAMLQRHMRFLALGLIEITSMAIASVAAVVSGLMGAGYWSLIIMHIVLAVALAVGNWIAFPWKPGLPRKGVGVREMLRFGGSITGFNIVNYFSRNADNILIGKIVGAAALGFYSKAYGLLMLPINQIRVPIQSVAVPALSRLQSDPARFRNYYLKIVTVLAFVSMPLMAFLAVYAEDIILLVLGRQWLPAAGIFRILAVAALIQPVATSTGMVMISLGFGRRFLMWGLINACLMVLSFVVGVYWGAIGVAWAYVIVQYLILFPSLWYCFKGSPVTMVSFVKVIYCPLISSIIMAFLLYLIPSLWNNEESFASVLIGLAAGSLIYFLILLLMPSGLKTLTEMYGFCKSIVKKSGVDT